MASRQELEQQLRDHWPRLRRFAYALSRSGPDADDLVQEVAIRALSRCDQWQAGSRFDSWLFRITRNLWIDMVRARGRRDKRSAPAEEAERIGHDPTSGMEAAIDLQTAMKAMQRLPDEQREVVALILIDGLGYREASETLGLPVGTVSSRLARGRTALLKHLGG
jgi:RNA polymerase sigma factor (sigma-70 family)